MSVPVLPDAAIERLAGGAIRMPLRAMTIALCVYAGAGDSVVEEYTTLREALALY